MIPLKTLIRTLNLKPHPEGGYFTETYRSSELISKRALPNRFTGARCLSTAIYFLIPSGEKSRLHRIKSDETWHFYLGAPLTLVEIRPQGSLESIRLGDQVQGCITFQHTVTAGSWFGAYCTGRKGSYSLVGCTVAPGFDFADLQLGPRAELIRRFPAARSLIERLT